MHLSRVAAVAMATLTLFAVMPTADAAPSGPGEGLLLFPVEDGIATASFEYSHRLGFREFWSFTWSENGVEQFTCLARGSIMTFFYAMPDCANHFYVQGMGADGMEVVPHEVDVYYAGQGGKGLMVFQAD
ncbi:MAG: hypothetical protein ACPGQL_02580 [Thermoplasmatota archaeon]